MQLRVDVRERVSTAVESLNGRVTVGDVAGRAGVSISDAEEALNALAADTQGTLEVSTLSRCPQTCSPAWCGDFAGCSHLPLCLQSLL